MAVTPRVENTPVNTHKRIRANTTRHAFWTAASVGLLIGCAVNAVGEDADVVGSRPPLASMAAVPAPQPEAAVEVAAVGDSLLFNLDAEVSAHTDIAVRSAREFTGGLEAAGYDPVFVSGYPGFATSQLLGAVNDAVALDPDAVVFVSGSNEAVDVAHGQAPTPDAASMADAIGAALDEMAGIGCVVWPTVTTQPNIPMYWGTQTWAPAEVNRALRDEAARRPNLHVVDWDALSAGHLPGSADPWYMPDGLHHTSTGETAFEAAILETLAQCEEQR